MTKIYFMLTSNSGVGSTTIFATRARRNIDDLLAFFSLSIMTYQQIIPKIRI